MRIQAKSWRRIGEIGGAACLIAALTLLSPGVRVVRAEGDVAMSVDPALVAAAERTAEKKNAPAAPSAPAAVEPGIAAAPAASVAFPTVHVDDTENAARPGVSAIEIEPGVVVLNTRGFNYGPPPTPISPEAMKQESGPR